MNQTPDLPILEVQILEGTSSTPPSLAGEDLFGLLIAWTDQSQGGVIYLASDQQDSSFQSMVINPDWTSWATPAIVVAYDWERVYLAWTDSTGAINLANSGDGWDTEISIAPAGSSSSELGPALAFDGELIYIAWSTPNGLLSLATCDKANNIQSYPTKLTAVSQPTLTWHQVDRKLYALSGGSADGDDQSMRFYVSTDRGQSFDELDGPKDSTIGPPSLVVIKDYYYLVWADAETGLLTFVATQDLRSYTTTQFSNACHDGGPALIAIGDSLHVGWTVQAPPEDPTSHHVALGKLPFLMPGPGIDKEKYIKRAHQLRVQDPCPDHTMTVYDPSQDKCVARGGCYGRCVLSSYMTFWNTPLFSPIRYAICVIACKTHK